MQNVAYNDSYLPALISDCRITVIDYEDYLHTDRDREEYDEYFREAYDKINRFPFSENEDIYTYAKSHESLGEIRSLYMAVKKHYSYFMSNDSDSKFLAKIFFSGKHTIDVKSLYDALVQCKETGTCLTWKQINPTVTNAMRSRQDKINQLKELYRVQSDVSGEQDENVN